MAAGKKIRVYKSRTPNVVNKFELAKTVAQKERLPLEEVIGIIDAYFNEVARQVIGGKKVSLFAFGVFNLKKFKAWQAKTFAGEMTQIPATESIKFTASQRFNKKLNR